MYVYIFLNSLVIKCYIFENISYVLIALPNRVFFGKFSLNGSIFR